MQCGGWVVRAENLFDEKEMITRHIKKITTSNTVDFRSYVMKYIRKNDVNSIHVATLGLFQLGLCP